MSEISDLTTQMAGLKGQLERIEVALADVRRLVGPFGAVFPDGSLLVQTLYGTKYFIDPSDDIMAPQLVVYRQWEPDLSKFMLSAVNKDTVFVDVGANFGYFTCLLASKIGVGGVGQVIAVEPNPKMIGLLRRNISINWSMAPVVVHECAVSNCSGFVELSVPEGRAANAGMVGLVKSPKLANESRFIVQSKPLIDILPDQPIDLIKVDVEGFEILVLSDIGRVFYKSPRLIVVMEWSPVQMLAAGFSVDDFIDIMSANSFGAFRIPPGAGGFHDSARELEITNESLRVMSCDNIILARLP